jgi:hypothetical protein
MLELLARHVIPAAYGLLPAPMASREATALVLTIAQQESGCRHRRQVRGPARSLWQFEKAGLVGVRTHRASGPHVAAALSALCYSADLSINHLYVAIEHNDLLGAIFARLLLWTLPDELPARDEPDRAWDQYVRAWRPGRPHPQTFAAHFSRAWECV